MHKDWIEMFKAALAGVSTQQHTGDPVAAASHAAAIADAACKEIDRRSAGLKVADELAAIR